MSLEEAGLETECFEPHVAATRRINEMNLGSELTSEALLRNGGGFPEGFSSACT